MVYIDDYKIIKKAELSDDERELILKYRSLSPEKKNEVLEKIGNKKQSENLALR